MIVAPKPPDEQARLESLYALDILDTPSEERFNRITRLARGCFDVPIALISLVEVERQWFKSCIGLDVSETDRDVSFCSHAILRPEPLIVPDALKDPRFADNPLVVGEPKIRFYAGQPLSGPDRQRVGTLCVIDYRPRRVNRRQREILRELAQWAEEELNSIGLERALRGQRAAQALVADVTDTIGDGLLTVDAAGRIRSFNRAAERIFGYSSNEVIGRAVDTLVSNEGDNGNGREGLLPRNATPVTTTIQGRRSDGSTLPLDLILRPTSEGDEADETFLGVVRDLSERVRTQEERRRFFSVSVQMLCIADFEGYFKDLNPAWTDVLGYSAHELLSRPFVEFVHPDDRENTVREAEALVRGDATALFENRYRCRDGSYRWLQWSAIASPEEGLIYAAATDVTPHRETAVALERQAAQLAAQAEELRESEERYRSLISAMEEGVVLQDRDGTILACNGSAERILGLSADQMMGRTSTDPRWRAVRPDGSPVPGEEHPAMVTLRTGEACSGEIMGIHLPSGEQRWISINAQPITASGERQPYAVVTSFTDVTARREIARMKDEFISVVSHELRTPLTSLRGALGLMASGASEPGSAAHERMLSIAVANAERLSRLINDILDIERIESGRVDIEPTPCSAPTLVDDAVDEMNAAAQTAGVELVGTSEPLTVQADRDRIIQTLTNLISNAIKFSDIGGRVTVVARQSTAGEVEFAVADRGRGIPPDQLESIFEPFAQVDASDSRDKGGTGLGLAICRSIVEHHGGRIWAENTPGGGATMRFVLPLEGHADAVNDDPTMGDE